MREDPGNPRAARPLRGVGRGRGRRPLRRGGHGALRGAAPLLVVGVGLTIAAFVVWGASSMLVRRVARPVDRILEAALDLQDGAPSELPLLGDSGIGLDRAALAFERT